MTRSTIEHARWIAVGILHPARMSDIPLHVRPWIDPVAFCVRTIERG